MTTSNEKQQAQVTLDPFAIPGYVGTKTIDDLKKRKGKPTGISIYTGAGGFDIGMSHAGFESRVMIEISPQACKTLRANWHWKELKKRQDYRIIDNEAVPGDWTWKSKEEMKKNITWYHDREPVILEKDIRTLTTKEILEAADLEIGEATVVYGGPPCQGFSTINTKRTIDDPRNFLFQEFVRIVREALPKTIIFENVPGLVSSTKGKVMREICKEFADCGYNLSWNIINCANYGVPQNRKRIILMGKRVDLLHFPEIGNPRLCMGAQPGKITHPAWYIKKYKFELTEQENTHDNPRQESVK